MRTKQYLFHLNCTTVADILLAWKVLVNAHRNHCIINVHVSWDCVFNILVVLGEVHICCSQDWELGNDCRGRKKKTSSEITHRTQKSNMRNDCERVMTTDKLMMSSEDSVGGFNHDKLIHSDHGDIGRPIKDVIEQRGGGGFNLWNAQNPIIAFLQNRGSYRSMEKWPLWTSNACAFSARGAVSHPDRSEKDNHKSRLRWLLKFYKTTFCFVTIKFNKMKNKMKSYINARVLFFFF